MLYSIKFFQEDLIKLFSFHLTKKNSRLSDDVPVQSDSIPLINIYFTVCMGFSLSAMIWFSIMNMLKENKKVPKFCKWLVLNVICYMMCMKNFKIKKNHSSLTEKQNNKGFEKKKFFLAILFVYTATKIINQ